LAPAELVGLDESDFSGRLAQLCTPEACFPGVAALRSRGKTALGQESPGAGGQQLKIEMADASKRVLEVSLREKNTESVKTILYLRDITHETEVDRLKSEFLSTAAHELRTPMTSIYGFTELLMTQEFEEADWREYLRIIFRHTELMVSIINELLDLARIEARHGKDFHIVSVDVLELLQEIVAGFKTPDGRAEPPVPRVEQSARVMADRKKLIQAVLNVISNAYKYSPDGGAVELDIVHAAAGADSPLDSGAAALGIRISDHGMGMTPEQLARVFERFYRADTSGKIPGTGLGMSIVQEIVALHGGKVGVTSAAGRGTTVTIWLPTAGIV
jgi:signal transduction histidine kinase